MADSVVKDYILKPKSSFLYYFNVFNYGIGFLLELKSEKRFTYQKYVYLDPFSRQSKPKSFKPSQKGQLNLNFSIPYVNKFHLKPIGENLKDNIGFWGFSAGVDYFYRYSKFINVTGSTVIDYLSPIIVPIDFSGEYEFMTSHNLTVSDNYKLRKWTFGYGINYVNNIWELRYYFGSTIPPSRIPTKKSSQSFGLTFNSYYQLSPNFNVGVIYRPTFFQVKPVYDFNYEFLISLDLLWRFRIN